MSQYVKGPWIVWRLESATSGEVAIVAKRYENAYCAVEHEYQKILWEGMAKTSTDAMAQYAKSKRTPLNEPPGFPLHLRDPYRYSSAPGGYVVPATKTQAGPVSIERADGTWHDTTGQVLAPYKEIT